MTKEQIYALGRPVRTLDPHDYSPTVSFKHNGKKLFSIPLETLLFLGFTKKEISMWLDG